MDYKEARVFLSGRQKNVIRPHTYGLVYDIEWFQSLFSEIATYMSRHELYTTGYILLGSPHGYPPRRFHVLCVPVALFRSISPFTDPRRVSIALLQTGDDGYPLGARRNMFRKRTLCVRLDILEQGVETVVYNAQK